MKLTCGMEYNIEKIFLTVNQRAGVYVRKTPWCVWKILFFRFSFISAIVYLYKKNIFLCVPRQETHNDALYWQETTTRGLKIKQRFVAYTFQVFRFDIEVSLAGLRQRAHFIISNRCNNALLPFQLQCSTFA